MSFGRYPIRECNTSEETYGTRRSMEDSVLSGDENFSDESGTIEVQPCTGCGEEFETEDLDDAGRCDDCARAAIEAKPVRVVKRGTRKQAVVGACTKI